jgi:putative SOS response-associated peptidase YedK
MCGRYSVGRTPEEIEEIFEAPVPPGLGLPRWNVAPTQTAPVVALTRAGEQRIVPLRWGLVPHWAADPSVGGRHINARAETVETTPAFRDAFAHRRVLVPADGFYEWSAGPGGKRPWWIHHARGGVLAFAGVRESWRPRAPADQPGVAGEPDAAVAEPLRTFAILTTEPNRTVAPLHDRMPVVLSPEDWAAWLDPSTPIERIRALLRPAPEGLLDARAVSTRVNRVENDDERCVEPGAGPELLDLFEGR